MRESERVQKDLEGEEEDMDENRTDSEAESRTIDRKGSDQGRPCSLPQQPKAMSVSPSSRPAQRLLPARGKRVA